MDYKIKLQNITKSTSITSINNDAIGLILKRLIHNSPRQTFLHICKNDKEASDFQKQIEFFSSRNIANDELEILNFPAWDCLPYDRVSPKLHLIAARINCLHKLVKNAPSNSALDYARATADPLNRGSTPPSSALDSQPNSSKKTLVITTINAVLQKTVPASLIKNLGFKIEVGDEVSIDLLASSLIDNGFSRTAIASGISEFAIRGNIVDIITSSNQIADDLIGYRLDFFGDNVESIRVFDPTTQITSNKVNQVSLLPMAEVNLNENSINNFKKNYRNIFGAPSEDIFYNTICQNRHHDGLEHFMPLFYDQPLSNIFEYLNNPQISFADSVLIAKDHRLKTINEYYQARVDNIRESKKSGAIYNPLPPENLYLSGDDFNNELGKNLVIDFATSKNKDWIATSLSAPRNDDVDNSLPDFSTSSLRGAESDVAIQKNNSPQRTVDLEIKPIPDFALASRANKTNVFELFKNFLEVEFKAHKIVLFSSSLASKERLRKILLEHEIKGQIIDKVEDISSLSKNQIGLGILPIGNGFITSDLMIIGESALFGEKTIRQTSRKSAEEIFSEGITLQVGELVVHRYHGIGKFDGLHNIEAGGIKNDFLKILYFGSDVLFVTIEDINLITRYGSENSLIILDKLGKNNWENRREKVKKKIKIAAEALIKIAAERHVKKAPIFIPNQMEYEEFKARFEFEETIDQIKAIDQIEEDFQKGSPMDRLVCGDVGFGKTEVAIRAAFIAASNEYKNKENPDLMKNDGAGDPRNAGQSECFALQNKISPQDLDPRNTKLNEEENTFPSGEKRLREPLRVQSEGVDKNFPSGEKRLREPLRVQSEGGNNKYQVAIITPTTLLCRQHYKNFVSRFEGTNLKIAQLSRMISTSEAKKVKQDLEDGKIDIIIGTHALLNKNIKFKKLGLMIVDEEQHFGVIQKERLKEFKNEVHILTLSATPIPRTMQMSLSGVKELSIIATPPADRMAVRNFVMPYDSVIIREAILREYGRGGRVFFVVPRISDLNQLHDNLRKQIPEVKIEIAHGQMPPAELDDKMNDFYDGKFDVLLSTTIIESGIDISFANTMIIYKAEHFGLAQLYQLRGRVGRGKTRGYCYFMTKIHNLSEIAKKKLKVIQSLETLGSGFSVASHDMDIRGSGNILGDEQSGHIRETGAELYQSMLLDEIKKLKNSAKNSSNQVVDDAPGSLGGASGRSSANENGAMGVNNNEEPDYQIQIKLGISLLIPEEYMADLTSRMQFYKRIAAIKTKEDQEQITFELIDRFGKIPDEIENLLQITYLKNLCRKLNIEKIETGSQSVLISFKDNHFENGEKLLEMVFSSKNQIKLQGHKILFLMTSRSESEKLGNTLLAINKLTNLL